MTSAGVVTTTGQSNLRTDRKVHTPRALDEHQDGRVHRWPNRLTGTAELAFRDRLMDLDLRTNKGSLSTKDTLLEPHTANDRTQTALDDTQPQPRMDHTSSRLNMDGTVVQVQDRPNKEDR